MDKQDAYEAYLPHIKKRWLVEQESWEQRRQQAWTAARRIAELLRVLFGAEQVIAFGSLTDAGPFDARSDIDIAVSGIALEDFFRAYAQAMTLSPDFELDLLDLSDCPQTLRSSILEKGTSL